MTLVATSVCRPVSRHRPTPRAAPALPDAARLGKVSMATDAMSRHLGRRVPGIDVE
ncbi:hypothetical protein I545_0983 [Mycobacterium kansasii 662]|uniref:Uncharacterized protein n=2 Tax=Mycobacterium kansasii TaxID=1768 RepID=A0A1V3XUW2_MYCKA|nr:hypothetical protein I547_0273 [Mycobacterium kansasii 824]EUA21105.1 hypothetical protein I545_0983 [Mycobacterium kansasii 662]KEP42958.1 hypothetical protein MKSMC1_19050 [Mycobacterium kansasii]OOK82566.1 hypothetical protein BZL30_0653 [Mycobacterium kansasii]OOK84525.1 hypothetical protein BZL29_1200 [Mycobacterium kansasii]